MPLDPKNTLNGVDLNEVDTSKLALVDKEGLLENLGKRLKQEIKQSVEEAVEATRDLVNDIVAEAVKNNQPTAPAGQAPSKPVESSQPSQPQSTPAPSSSGSGGGSQPPKKKRSGGGGGRGSKGGDDDFTKALRVQQRTKEALDKIYALQRKGDKKSHAKHLKENVYSSKGVGYAEDLDEMASGYHNFDRKELENAQKRLTDIQEGVRFSTFGKENELLTKATANLQKELAAESKKRETVLGRIGGFLDKENINAASIISGILGDSPMAGLMTKATLEMFRHFREKKQKLKSDKMKVGDIRKILPRGEDPKENEDRELKVDPKHVRDVAGKVAGKGDNESANVVDSVLENLAHRKQLETGEHQNMKVEYMPPGFRPMWENEHQPQATSPEPIPQQPHAPQPVQQAPQTPQAPPPESIPHVPLPNTPLNGPGPTTTGPDSLINLDASQIPATVKSLISIKGQLPQGLKMIEGMDKPQQAPQAPQAPPEPVQQQCQPGTVHQMPQPQPEAPQEPEHVQFGPYKVGVPDWQEYLYSRRRTPTAKEMEEAPGAARSNDHQMKADNQAGWMDHLVKRAKQQQEEKLAAMQNAEDEVDPIFGEPISRKPQRVPLAGLVDDYKSPVKPLMKKRQKAKVFQMPTPKETANETSDQLPREPEHVGGPTVTMMAAKKQEAPTMTADEEMVPHSERVGSEPIVNLLQELNDSISKISEDTKAISLANDNGFTKLEKVGHLQLEELKKINKTLDKQLEQANLTRDASLRDTKDVGKIAEGEGGGGGGKGIDKKTLEALLKNKGGGGLLSMLEMIPEMLGMGSISGAVKGFGSKMMGKVKGLFGKAGKVAEGVEGAAEGAGKLGKVAEGAEGAASAGKVAGAAGKLGKVGKFLGKIADPLMVLDTAVEGIKGYKDTNKIVGRKTTTEEKVLSGATKAFTNAASPIWLLSDALGKATGHNIEWGTTQKNISDGIIKGYSVQDEKIGPNHDVSGMDLLDKEAEWLMENGVDAKRPWYIPYKVWASGINDQFGELLKKKPGEFKNWLRKNDPGMAYKLFSYEDNKEDKSREEKKKTDTSKDQSKDKKAGETPQQTGEKKTESSPSAVTTPTGNPSASPKQEDPTKTSAPAPGQPEQLQPTTPDQGKAGVVKATENLPADAISTAPPKPTLATPPPSMSPVPTETPEIAHSTREQTFVPQKPSPSPIETGGGFLTPHQRETEGSTFSPAKISGSQQKHIDAITAELKSQGMNEKQIAAIVGNVGKETGFSLREENLRDYKNTSNDHIRTVFGKERTNMSDEELTKLKQDPEKFAEAMYGRGSRIGKGMGNTEEGDGYKFRGRGYIQLTGKNNYAKASKEIFGDDRLVKNPELVNQPEVASKVVGWYTKNRGDRMAKSMGIDLQNGSQEDINLAYTSAIAGRKIKRGEGYLGNQVMARVDKYSAATQGPSPVLTASNIQTNKQMPMDMVNHDVSSGKRDTIQIASASSDQNVPSLATEPPSTIPSLIANNSMGERGNRLTQASINSKDLNRQMIGSGSSNMSSTVIAPSKVTQNTSVVDPKALNDEDTYRRTMNFNYVAT